MTTTPSAFPSLATDLIVPHAYAELATRDTLEWARTFPLGDAYALARLEAYDCGLYGASVLPTDAPPELVSLCARYFAWLIAFDDDVGECDSGLDMARLAAATAALDPMRGNDDTHLADDLAPYILAFRSLRDDGVSHADPAWGRRFQNSVRAYMLGCLQEAPYRITASVPTPDAYMRFRHQTIGARPVLDIAALAYRTYPAPFDPRAPASEAVRKRLARAFAFANDLLSYRNCETEADEEDRLNVVTVIAHDKGLTIPHAQEQCAADYACMRTDLLDGTEASAPDVRVMVQRAVDGNLHWYRAQQGTRYRSTDA